MSLGKEGPTDPALDALPGELRAGQRRDRSTAIYGFWVEVGVVYRVCAVEDKDPVQEGAGACPYQQNLSRRSVV